MGREERVLTPHKTTEAIEEAYTWGQESAPEIIGTRGLWDAGWEWSGPITPLVDTPNKGGGGPAAT